MVVLCSFVFSVITLLDFFFYSSGCLLLSPGLPYHPLYFASLNSLLRQFHHVCGFLPLIHKFLSAALTSPQSACWLYCSPHNSVSLSQDHHWCHIFSTPPSNRSCCLLQCFYFYGHIYSSSSYPYQKFDLSLTLSPHQVLLVLIPTCLLILYTSLRLYLTLTVKAASISQHLWKEIW